MVSNRPAEWQVVGRALPNKKEKRPAFESIL
jgi:hypothetical protein